MTLMAYLVSIKHQTEATRWLVAGKSVSRLVE